MPSFEKPKPADKQKPRGPRKISESGLRNAALHYLQRFSSSKENLKRVLMRRVQRAAHVHETDMDQATQWIEALVASLARSGMVDDKLYAEGRTRALFRRGVPPNGIAQRLRQKGVEPDLIESVLSDLYEETVNPTLLAAIKLAKRRRLGPYRSPDIRAERQDKDLAAIARAGFDYETARKVVFAESASALEDLTVDPEQ